MFNLGGISRENIKKSVSYHKTAAIVENVNGQKMTANSEFLKSYINVGELRAARARSERTFPMQELGQEQLELANYLTTTVQAAFQLDQSGKYWAQAHRIKNHATDLAEAVRILQN